MAAPIGISPVGGPRIGKGGVSAVLEPARETETASAFNANQQALIRRSNEAEYAPEILAVPLGADERNPWGMILEGAAGGYGTQLRPVNFAVTEITEPEPPPAMDWPVPPESIVGASASSAWQIPGPPRANSPRQDPEFLQAWTNPRAVDRMQRDPIKPGRPVHFDHDALWAAPPPVDQGTRAGYIDAQARDQDPRIPWTQPPPKDEGPRAPWEDGKPRDERPRAPYIDAPPKDIDAEDPVRPMAHRDVHRRGPTGDMPHRDRHARDSVHAMRQAGIHPRVQFGTYGPTDYDHEISYGKVPRHRVYVPEQRDYANSQAANFNLRADKVDPARSITPPGETPPDNPQGIHTRPVIEAHRLDADGNPAEPLTLTDITISTDIDSWNWQLNAQTDKPGGMLLAPRHDQYQRLAVTIQGTTWRIIVERLSITRGPDGDRRTIQGRSLTAALDAPHAPQRSRRRHLEQPVEELARQELREAADAFEVEWRLPTWEVPQDTFTYQDQTPARAINAIAQGLGATVYTPPNGERLQIRRRYQIPASQWAETSTARAIPISYVQDAEGKWEDTPRYAIAWATGTTSAGVTVRGYREEWDDPAQGPISAPVKTSPMITTETAGRERVQAVIDASGPKLIDTLTMPLAEEVGLMEPGRLIRLYDGAAEMTGIVRSVDIQATLTAVQQAIALETRPEAYRRIGGNQEQPAPDGDTLDMDMTDDDIYQTTPGGWVIVPETGPRDVGIRIPTPNRQPIAPTETAE